MQTVPNSTEDTPVSDTLDSQIIETVKSTAPVLAEHGEAIAIRLYELLLSSEPELTEFFNPTNQANQRQARALADAVYAVASNIDNIEVLLPAVVQIAHKHRSLQIKPEHYPIVGENLLLAISQVLGLDPGSEIISAWAKTYDLIAQVFIDLEAQLYKDVESQPGGWSGFKEFEVVKKHPESSVITSFYLRPLDKGPIAAYLPGQYVTIKIRRPQDPYPQTRHYSLSDSPGKDYYRISVKKEDSTAINGAVSNYLHTVIKEGDVVSLAAPAGVFTLDLDSLRPLVLISGGVGVTPLISMLDVALEKQPNRPITFIQAALDSSVHAMKSYIADVVENNPHVKSFICYEQPNEADQLANNFHQKGFIDSSWLKEILEETNADFYFCGPPAFMSTVDSILEELGVPKNQRQFEFFGPAKSL